MFVARQAILLPNGWMDVIPRSRWIMCVDLVPYLWMDYILNLYCIGMMMVCGMVVWTSQWMHGLYELW